MSKYTTTIYEILKNTIPGSENLSVDELVTNGVDTFFNFSFPWYSNDDTGKREFCEMYLTRYMVNEIGQETLGAHKLMLKSLLTMYMEQMKQKYNLLSNMSSVAGERRVMHNEIVNDAENSTTESEQTTTTTSTGNQKQDTESIHSDNPQVTYAKNDYASDMDREETVVETTDNGSANSNGTTEGNRTATTNRNLSEIETDTRNSDKYFKAIQEGVYLINTELVEKCRRLFMQLW